MLIISFIYFLLKSKILEKDIDKNDNLIGVCIDSVIIIMLVFFVITFKDRVEYKIAILPIIALEIYWFIKDNHKSSYDELN